MSRKRYLLDTHIFIWNATDKKKLGSQVRDELDDINNLFYLSRTSLIEIAIKDRDNDNFCLKWDYEKFLDYIENFGVELLEIDNRHLRTLNRLTYPKNHKDPVDHLIISQAGTDKLCLISADGKMPYYRKQGLDLLEN